MKTKVIKMEGRGKVPVQEFVQRMEKVCLAMHTNNTEKLFADGRVTFLSFEKYYLRNNSTAALSVLITETDDNTEADIVACGGGQGVLNISWGANKNFAEEAAELLQKYGLTIKEQ